MTRRLVFRPQAESELLHARSWYEKQRPGLGRAFADAVETVLTGISQTPFTYPSVHGETRRALVRQYPYAVYFRVLAGEIVVLAVMHGRRHPSRWQSRR